jgi:SAM-dependent MidA family methyltransferase
MPFSSFMGQALYHPELGYYAAAASRTGKEGDFYTSVSVGPVFGELMAGQFCRVWELTGKPGDFTVIEAGANDGRFACDVLDWARRQRPDFYAALTVQIDEILPSAAERQRKTLADHAGHFSHDAVLPAASGCYFANEVLDAVPFRRVRLESGVWRELRVGLAEDGDGDEFAWVTAEPEDRALKRRLEWLGNQFPEGYTTEIAPAVASHVRLAASRLEKGVLIFADYGYAAADYYADHRTAGTLRCYRQHQAGENPFLGLGETDITAHADFSLAASAAVGSGCEVAGFLDQSRFLTGAAETVLRGMEGQSGQDGAAWRRQFQTLTHPAHMGQSFHFLVLGKAMPQLANDLPCLKFARPSSAAELLQPSFGPQADKSGPGGT